MHYEIITIVAVDVGKSFGVGEIAPLLSRSAPPYKDLLPKYREMGENFVTVRGKKVYLKTKFYEPDIVVVEARMTVASIFSHDVLEMKKLLVKACTDEALKNNPEGGMYEEYSMFCVSGYASLKQFDREKVHIVGLMRNEIEDMDKGVVEQALRESSLKYSSNDLVVVGWDSAVLFSDDNREFPEIIEILTAGNMQLLKIRLVNKELEDGLESLRLLTTKGLKWFKLRLILKKIIQLRTTSIFELEQTKANINLLGDWYTATLYALTTKKFHLDEKMEEVHKRLDALEDMYEMVSLRLDNYYLILLEFLITVLIVFELVLAFI